MSRLLVLLLVLALLPLAPVRAQSDYGVVAATVNGERHYLGLGGGDPVFTWAVTATRRGTRQRAYRIIVASSEAQVTAGVGDVWDSGRVASTSTTGIGYEGPPLEPRTRYHWAVQSWDDEGAEATSLPGWFETALDTWTATWIARDVPEVGPTSRGPDPRISQLRRAFTLPAGEIIRARLYATALGVYRAELNGRPVADDRLAPGWTDYRDRVQFQTYDVTGHLRPGANAIGVTLATGWYAGHISNIGKNTYGSGTPGFLGQLEVAYADGRLETVASDLSWRTVQGPTTGADLQDGEHFDARADTPGWTTADYDDATWEEVVEKTDLPAGAAVLVPQADQPVRVTQRLPPVSVERRGDDTHLVDFGQNLVGVAELRVTDADRGTTVSLRFGEALDASGDLDTTNLRAALATDSYTSRGDAVEEWAPAFTFHGFRYVEVTGYPGDLPPSALTALVLGTDVPLTSAFASTDERLDRLVANAEWSLRGNFLSVPTDCPQRDERMGWTGDLNVFAPTAALLADVRRFLGDKWMGDVRDEQGPDGQVGLVVPDPVGQFGPEDAPDIVWSSAAITVPYTVWQASGELQVVEESWAAMTAFMRFWEEQEPQTVIGDWAPPPADPADVAMGRGLPELDDLLARAWFVRDADLMNRMATAAGRHDEARRYIQLAQDARADFAAAHVRGGGRLEPDAQTAYAVALAFDLLPADQRRAASDRLAALVRDEGDGWDLATGFVGTPLVLAALSEHDNVEAAFRLLTQDDYPSWLHQVELGATTMWEFWNGLSADGSLHSQLDNSLNHYAFGAVARWIHTELGGIQQDPERAGYAHFTVRPRAAGGVEAASSKLATVRGTVVSSWRHGPDGFALDVTVPANATATVHIPTSGDPARILEVGESPVPATQATGVVLLGVLDGEARFEVGSGQYAFRVSA